MNIFALSTDSRTAARMMCNRHVVKMITESAQMLAVACKEIGVAEEYMPLTQKGTPWKGTAHVNHPCTRWVASNYGNAEWLVGHARELNHQFRIRFGDVDHASMAAISHMHRRMITLVSEAIDEGKTTLGPMALTTGRTPFARAFGDFVVGDDVPTVQAYREYYKQKVFADGKPMKWGPTDEWTAPDWYTDDDYEHIELPTRLTQSYSYRPMTHGYRGGV